jgi:hypothetical protein
MTYQNLPPEILLKIGKYLTSEKDFVSFTLTDRRTFLFFSKENAIWREKLEDYDKVCFFLSRMKDWYQFHVFAFLKLFISYDIGFLYIASLL